MFSLVSYIFGNNKHDDNDALNEPKSFPCYENDNLNQCSQSNIENDWILIDLLEKNLAKKIKTVKKIKKLNLQTHPNNELPTDEESWFVEPPECFKNSAPNLIEAKASSLENLLIEHPSKSVFNNLLVKRSASNGKIAQCGRKGSIKIQSNKKIENQNVSTNRPIKKKPNDLCFEPSVKGIKLSFGVLNLSVSNKSRTLFYFRLCQMTILVIFFLYGLL